MNFNISNLASIVFSVNKSVSPQKPMENKEFFPSPTNKELLSNLNSRQLDGLYMQVSNAATNIMNNIQQNIFLRDMLGLPKEWANLLKEFPLNTNNAQLAAMLKGLNTAGTNSVNSTLLALLQAQTRVDLAALAEHLNKNSALMADKLLKYMGAANMNQQNIAQLKEIMLIGASIANSAQVNPQEFIRDIIQMYLPWLPLVPPTDKDLSEIEAKMTGEDIKNAQVVFYLSTKSLGYFKVEILLDDENEIYINNVCEKDDDDIRKTLQENLDQNIKKTSINAKLYYSRKIDTEDEKLNLKDKQIFIINSSDSLVGLTLIQLISKVIFEFDEKQGQRFEKVNA